MRKKLLYLGLGLKGLQVGGGPLGRVVVLAGVRAAVLQNPIGNRSEESAKTNSVVSYHSIIFSISILSKIN